VERLVTTKCESPNLFCRVNVDSEMTHNEFVSFVARGVGGVARMNSIRNQRLDISVDENDVFDAAQSREGADRWLYFRYTLEIDPVEDVSPSDYVTAIETLLGSLWSSGLDAVASCDFEDRLPRNLRRLRWGQTPTADPYPYQSSPDPLPGASHADAGAGPDS
jgi:hypothetical protein